MPANVDTMFSGRGEVPWHKLGTIVEGTPTSEEAIRLAGLDWQVEKHPIFARIPTGVDPVTGKQTGSFRRVDSLYATVRSDNRKPLGVVGPVYQPVDNVRLFACLDAIREASGGVAQYETAGSLGAGEVVWMLMVAGEDLRIAGDAIRPYVLARGAHDGSGSVIIRPCDTRVVCANTLGAAMAETVIREVRIRHSASAGDRLRQAAQALGVLGKAHEAFAATAETLLARSFSASEMRQLADSLLPKPDDSDPTTTSRMVTNWSQRMDTLMRGAYMARDLDNIRPTAWGALNAVVDYEQHLVAAKGDTLRRLETAFTRATEPGPLARKALALLLPT